MLKRSWKVSLLHIRFSVLLGIVFSFLFVPPTFAQGTGECPDRGPLSLTDVQNLHLSNTSNSPSRLADYFDSEYMVIDMSAHRCPHCVNFALSHNNDTDFQNRVSEESTCDFLVVVENNTLGLWLQQIGGAQTFIGQKSRQLTQGSFYDIPTLYGGEPSFGIPHFLMIDRDGELVAEQAGGLPDEFYELCNICGESGTGDNEDDNEDDETCQGGDCGDDNGGDDNGGDDNGGDDNGGDDNGGDDNGGDDNGGDDNGGDDNGGDDNGGDDNGGDDNGGDDNGGDDNGGDDNGGDDSSDPSYNPPNSNSSNDSNSSSSNVDFNPNIGDLRIDIPGEAEDDIVSETEYITARDAKMSFYDLFKKVNGWVWIAVLVVAFIVIIYAGYVILMSRGNSDKLTKGINVLLYLGIGIGVALLALVIVSLVVNLFPNNP